MRAFSLALALIVAVPAWAIPTSAAGRDVGGEPAAPSNAAFRAKLISNAAAARRASTKLAALAKQPAPAKLSSAERQLYVEHTRWLSDAATRLATVHTKMEAVLAKGDRAPITEVATTNMELVNVRDAIEAESKRFDTLAKPAKPRHASAMSAVRAQ